MSPHDHRAPLDFNAAQNPLPFGTTPAGVKAARNLHYLRHAGCVPVAPLADRTATDLTRDNHRRAERRQALRRFGRERAAIQGLANAHWLAGSSSIPARRKAQRAAQRGH
ncbi:MAG: hypothetical protein NVS3B25_07260 [Hymenobacter sp.]